MGIRRLALTDETQVLAINIWSRPGVAALDGVEFRRLSSIANYHLVAERGPGQVIGYLLAFDNDADYHGEEFDAFRKNLSAPYIYIDQIAVAAGFREAGIGKLLYDALGALALQNSVPTICCEVNLAPLNSGSMAFHEKMGFRRISTMTTLDGRVVELKARDVVLKSDIDT